MIISNNLQKHSIIFETMYADLQTGKFQMRLIITKNFLEALNWIY